MSGKRYTAELKTQAVKQVLERGHSTASVAARLGINKHSLYDWVAPISKLGTAAGTTSVATSDTAEIRRLKAELKHVTEERDILKKAAAYFAKLSG
jgi:transposase